MEPQTLQRISRLMDQHTPYELVDTLLGMARSMVGPVSLRLFEIYPITESDDSRNLPKADLQMREWRNRTSAGPVTFLHEAADPAAPFAPGQLTSDPHGPVRISLGLACGVWRVLQIERGVSPAAQSELAQLAEIFARQARLLDHFGRDALTRLFNRQTFEHRLQSTVEDLPVNLSRNLEHSRCWLAMLDLDHFKQINDKHGHLFGDEILLVFAQIMRRSFRFDDLLFRYGGEEFVAILLNTDLVGAVGALDRFRQAVADHRFPHGDPVTVSIGWTELQPHVLPTSLLDQADRALYAAKDAGRNRVIGFPEVFCAATQPGLIELF